MSVTITINGELILDQTTGIQLDNNDVPVGVTTVGGPGNDILTGSLDADFLTFLNGLSPTLLTDPQMAFAARVEGASAPNLVSVNATAGETIGKLFFSDSTGNDLDGDQVFISPGNPLQTVGGQSIYLWSAMNGKVVLATTSSADASSGSLVAAFYIEANDAANSSAKVESITFTPLAHPDSNNPDDRVDFSDILRVAAVITTPIGDDIGVDDDAPTIVVSGTEPTLTVDETVLTTDASADFSTAFTPDFGTDGAGAAGVTYALGAVAGASGLVDTTSGQNVVLSKTAGGVIEGRTATDNDLVFKVSVDALGNVTLDQQRAVVHTPNTGPDQSTTLASDDLVKLTATITDADGDHDAATLNIGQNLVFKDDAPSAPTAALNIAVNVDETAGVNATADPNSADDVAVGALPAAVATKFTAIPDSPISFAKGAASLVNLTGGGFGADGAASSDPVTYALSVTNGTASGLSTSHGGTQVFLYNGTGNLAGLVLGRVGNELAGGDTANPNGAIAFALTVDGNGVGYIAEHLAVQHATAGSTPAAFDEVASIVGGAVQITATYTDKDGDQTTTAPTNVGAQFKFQDDGPQITVPSSATQAAPAHLGNALNQFVTGDFGYDLGSDGHPAAFYTAGGSDFVDANTNSSGLQLSLTGAVTGPPSGAITNTNVTLTSEDAASATFNFSFHYDGDPITAGVQDATAGGTLEFDKNTDRFKVTMTDTVEGFSFSVLHSSELLQKAPAGNTGHPEIVVTELDTDSPGAPPDGFYVQFTANSNPNGSPFGFNGTGDGAPIAGDTAFNNGQFVTSNFEDWVSATQTTNGVAGDTIQKGEVLTLRFFGQNILGDVNPNAPGGGSESLDPSTTADGVVIKFDGIGNSEDLILVLDLKDANGNETTRAVNVQNSDMFKGNTVPSPYNSEFTLDNNDALLILERNDYNAAGETYQIQGMQIMQSANGLTGNAINLNGAVGPNGGSSATSNLTAWDPLDQDVLKIVDIGFIQTTSGTQQANLDFAFTLADADNDTTALQHINVNISNGWIV